MSQEAEDFPARPNLAPGGRGGIISVLANQAFLRLWMAQALSQTAQQTINFTLLIQVRRIIEERGLGGGNTAVAILILTFATPPIFFSALAGVVVDRSEKRLIMALVNFGRACCIAGYLFLRTDWPLLTSLLYIYALCFTFSSIGQFFGPAEGSTIPILVSREQLISANALFSLTFIGSQLLGFVILGPLLTHLVGLRSVYIIVVVLYCFCGALILSLPRLPRAQRGERSAEQRTVRSDLREVVQYLAHDPLLRKAIAYLTIANSAFLMLSSLAPDYVSSVLKLPSERLIAIIGPAGFGMIVGVVAVGRLGRRRNREMLVDRALISSSTLLLLFATVPSFLAGRSLDPAGILLTPPVIVAMVFAIGLGVANAFIIVPSQTMLQERSNEQIRARVLSAFFTTSNAVALIPILFAGVLGDLFGVERVLTAIALLALSGGLIADRSRRRHARRASHR
ncbi:MAG TPA: MFS transporter [Thermomicrobiales bacterium]|jgi:MFS family permease